MATRTWDGNDETTPNDWSVAGNWEEGAVPVAADSVRIPVGSAAITAGLNQSAIGLDEVIIEEGFDQNIGTDSDYLQIDPDTLIISAIDGQQWIDIGSANINVEVRSTGFGNSGERGLYLLGSDIDTLSVLSGQVGVASNSGETSTIATARLVGNGSLWLGAGLSLTTLYQVAGSVRLLCDATTVTVHDGTLITEESGAITTLNVNRGLASLTSRGTIGTLNHGGGTVDLSRSGIARTISTYAPDPDGDPLIIVDEDIVTITSKTQPSGPTETTYARASLT